jgi:CHASE2 domain/CHAT domain
MSPYPLRFYLEVRRVAHVCLFKLSWGNGQQLTTELPYPETLKTLYDAWQAAYLQFYRSGTRARPMQTGSGTLPAVDWAARLAQAEAALLAEFHLWLRDAQLFDLRSTLQQATAQTDTIELFLSCDPLEVARLPWEAWQLQTELGANTTIQILRYPPNIRAATVKRSRRGKARVLAILGDETGLDFQAERQALKSLHRLTDITFVGWQKDKSVAGLKQEILAAIDHPQGWDILFFAGHSNETDLTGGELGIAPGESLLVSQLAACLTRARDRGLQFALFNSCKGLKIADALIDLGLSQVAIMREPIHNRVAQEFLLRLLENMKMGIDTNAAMITACQSLKLRRNITDPSAYLIPSLFRHPDSQPFQLRPLDWKRWLPTKREAIVVGTLAALSLFPSVQQSLLEFRTGAQAVHRQVTQRIPPANPDVLLVQIDEATVKDLPMNDRAPILNRQLLATIVQRIQPLKPKALGIDYLFDTAAPDAKTDAALKQTLQVATQQGIKIVVGAEQGKETRLTSAAVDVKRTTVGYVNAFPWHVELPPQADCALACPFAYQTALAAGWKPLGTPNHKPPIVHSGKSAIIPPNSSSLLTGLHLLQPTWFSPILDFSIPPDRAYRMVSASKLLKQPNAVAPAPIVLIAKGEYAQGQPGETPADVFEPPPAVWFWRPDQKFTGGEVHAYMLHHLLHQRWVMPLPDLGLILVAALVGKYFVLQKQMLLNQKRRLLLVLVSSTIFYIAVCLEIYISVGLLIPISLPLLTIWLYSLPTLRGKLYAR